MTLFTTGITLASKMVKEVPRWLGGVAKKRDSDTKAKISEQQAKENASREQFLQKQLKSDSNWNLIEDQWNRLNINSVVEEVGTLFEYDGIETESVKEPNVFGEIYKEQSVVVYGQVSNGNADERMYATCKIFTICLNNKEGLFIKYGQTSCKVSRNPGIIKDEDDLKRILGEKILEAYNKEGARIAEWKRKESLLYDPRYGDRA